MKIFVTLLILFMINNAKGALNGNCKVDGIDDLQWSTAFQNVEIEDNKSGVIISKTTTDVLTCKGDSIYFDVLYDSGVLNISTSSEFENYELNEKHQSVPVTIAINLEFTCSVGKGTLPFYQPIKDLNTYKPTFQEPSYTFKLPMPLPEGINLQCLYNVEIQACDDDISNLKLDFEVDPPDFLMTMEKAIDDNNRCFSAKITTSNPLNLDKTTDYKLIVKDGGTPTEYGSGSLVIEIDEDAVTIPSIPQFSSAYFTGTYDNTDDNHKINFEEIKLIKNYPNLDVQLIGDQANYFKVSATADIVTITLESNLPPDIIEKNVFIILTLEAAVPNAEAPGRTALIISMPTKECPTTTPLSTTACPTTESPTECPICTTEKPICPTTETPTECPPCTTQPTTITSCPPCTTEQPTCPTSDTLTECPICSTEVTTIFNCPPCSTEKPACPTSETPTGGITISTCPPCITEPTICPTECPVCSTEGSTTYAFPPNITEQPTCSTECPVCSSTEGITSSTCPPCSTDRPSGPTECPITSTEACPTQCPECTTTTPTKPRVTFLENSYNFHVVLGGHETVGFVKAIAIPEEVIEYELISDGDVLIVHTIDEKKPNSILLPCPNGQTTCIYKYLDHYPLTDETLFHSENGYLNIDPISLEMDQIKNLLNPQFTVNLQLMSDQGSVTNEMIESADDENRHWLYLPEKIPRTSNNLLVSVIIKDDNDHEPVFKVGSKLTVGYPMKSLLNAISPPYLVKVEATDMDKGINADIRYTTSETDIIVHPKTGIVYPGGNAFDGNVNRKFSVVATDMDGQDGGLSATLEVEVVLLSEQHLAFLTLNDKALEDVDNIIKELSQETNLNINYLTASIIPIGQENSLFSYIKKLTSTKQDQNYSIKMVIYALTLDNTPVPADTLKDSLEEVDESFQTDNWRSSCGGSSTNEELTNVTGYIAGIAVLASLLIIFMVVVAVLYYVKIYKKRKIDSYNSMGEEDTDSMKSDKLHSDENDQTPKKRLTKYVYNSPPPEDDDSVSDSKNYETVPEKTWSSENSSAVYNDPIDIKLNNEKRSSYDLKLQIDDNVDDDSKEISKSVSFKPIVEKFNIVTDAVKEDENVDVRNCNVEGVNEGHWLTSFTNTEIDDNLIGVFKTFNTENVVSVDANGIKAKYFEVTYGSNVLTIATSTEFKNYETTENHETTLIIVFQLKFVCTLGSGSLSFYQPVRDLNTYNPQFSQPSYTFELPMPLPSGVNLQCLHYIPIEACDFDITNMELSFQIQPPGDFSVVSSGPTDQSNKCFTATISTSQHLFLEENADYELIVTDAGTPPWSSSAFLKIEINQQTAILSRPQFSSAYYSALYDETEDEHKVQFDIIKLGVKYLQLDLTLIGDQQNDFDVNHNEEIVTVTLKQNFPADIINEKAVVILTLEAKIPDVETPGRTALVIYMPSTTSTPITTDCPVCTTVDTSTVTCSSHTTDQPNSECSTVALIVAVAILASLLVILIIVASIVYYLKIYKKKLRRKSDTQNSVIDEDTESVKSEQSEKTKTKEKPKRRPTNFVFNPPPPEEDDDDVTDNKEYESVPNRGWPVEAAAPTYNDPINITVSDGKRSSYEIKREDNVDKGKNEPAKEVSDQSDDENPTSKSVSFKPIVEKYNIMIDDEKENDQDDD
ncbi:hypothetical protein FQR65_LT04574 [Abscondita terminalis]|nr:hypothetical protein FQR65_LT04574 [Abscondita terminalis]